MQLSIDDVLTQYTTVTFQIALLYTSSKGKRISTREKRTFVNSKILSGERRIRVHTLALPVSKSLQEIYANADQEAVVSLIAKMGKMRYFQMKKKNDRNFVVVFVFCSGRSIDDIVNC